MATINYQNLPSTSTPLNAANLNSMQTSTPVRYTYSNTNVKKGSLIFYKYGRLVYFFSTGDAVNVPAGTETEYLTFSNDLLPIENVPVCVNPYNKDGYVYLKISDDGKAYLGNYTGTSITSSTNFAVFGCYISKT